MTEYDRTVTRISWATSRTITVKPVNDRRLADGDHDPLGGAELCTPPNGDRIRSLAHAPLECGSVQGTEVQAIVDRCG